MISSRCNDPFPIGAKSAKKLSDVRAQLKSDIESIRIFGQPIFEVWINEKATEDSSKQAWDRCIEQARDCDIFIALFNGNAGWPDTAGTVGICHAEFQTAYTSAPGKVFIVNIHEPKAKGASKGAIHILFQNYIQGLKRFDARASSEAQLFQAVRQIVSQATVKLVHRGVRDAQRGSSYVGPALDWSRLNYVNRAARMKDVTLGALTKDVGGDVHGNRAQRNVEGKSILFVVNAIPDALSISAAREIVGQPHLFDHTLHDNLRKIHGGPVHLIACQKGVTEAHARAMLGFPDATVVSPPFGIYVIDPVQGIQLVLLAQCRDETSTRVAVQRFFEWLDESEQGAALVGVAAKRKAIVEVFAAK